MAKQKWLLAVTAIAATCLLGGAAANSRPEAMITSARESERDAARNEIIRSRHETIQKLLELVRPPRQPGNDPWLAYYAPRNIAIECLGEYRAVEAIPALVVLLEPQPGELVTSDRVFRLSPAATALVKIGSPSIPALIEVIKTNSKSEFLLPQARLVVYDIEGYEGGRFRLQQAIAAEANAEKKKVLQENLAIFEKEMKPKATS